MSIKKRAKRAKAPTKRWLLWCTIEDTPNEDEAYLTEDELRPTIFNDLQRGIRVTNLRIQELPERKKVRLPASPKVTPTDVT
jgi:hypothetical protein